jgi:nicotinamidase-related amidase
VHNQPLPLPRHFDPAIVGKVWQVAYQQRAAEAEAWAKRHQLASTASDLKRVCLLLVDCQNTFCTPGFELFVAGRSGNGAVEDSCRLCEFIYRNLGSITQIIATLDTHSAIQIFHPVFWVDAHGRHPLGGQTVISFEDVRSGKWQINSAIADSLPLRGRAKLQQLQRFAEYYARQLTESGKYPLMIWPYHAMLGGIGHALVSAVEEALFFHGVARKSAPSFRIKGNNPLTEHYSALLPEVRHDENGRRIAAPDRAFLRKLLAFDLIIIAGQAKSHCVAWTVQDLLSELHSRGKAAKARICLLEDCTSPVVIPGAADFTAQAEAAFNRFAQAGIRRVKSSDCIQQWPELQT